jgi:hypothetical protein
MALVRFALVCLAIAFQGASALAAEGPADEAFAGRVRPFLLQHCQECHGAKKAKGDFRVDTLAADFDRLATRDRWQVLLDRVKAGEMPPEPKPRPEGKDLQALYGWIGQQMEAAAARRVAEGRVVLRRLNRIEYENTVCDLLGVAVELKAQLPADGAAHGFDNIGEALHTSSFLMEKYLAAADTALNVAIVNRTRPPTLKKTYSVAESHQFRSAKERVYRKMDDRVVCFSSYDWHSVTLSPFYPSERGLYRFRFTVSGFQSDGKPVTFSVTSGGGLRGKAGKSGLLGYFDAPPDTPAVIEFVESMEPMMSITILPYGLPSSRAIREVGAEDYKGPGLAVHGIEVEGPLHDTWPPAGHRRLFGDLPQGPAPIHNQAKRVEVVSKAPESDAGRILRDFVRRAFRRAVTADDVNPYLDLVKARLAENQSFEQAVRTGFMAVMVSPEFLFLREKPGKLDDFALASRLSYFLWSTMPDDELLTLAEQKTLSDPDTLRRQVERMLRDEKALAFTENFIGQWLGLRDIDATEPSHRLYPEYDHMLKVSMIREAELFFAEVLKDDLSLTNFVASDFSMLNGRLARHYGIPGLDGWEFRKVELPPNSHRGGLLTMAAVLKVTANGTTTSPVLRGAWVLDRILGTPPSPPPEGVAGLDPDIRGAVTIRDQLAKHRTVPSCAACHVKIDPPGFALESFDVIGGWRDDYRATGNGVPVMIDGQKMPYLKGKKVDPSDVMPTGESFRDVDEFKQILLKDRDQIARSLAIKLLTYATGAPPAPGAEGEIDAIVAAVKDGNYGFRTLVHEIVQSESFQTK